MNKSERLRNAYIAWQADQTIDTINALMEEAVPYARGIVRSTLNRRPDLQDDAESTAICKIFQHLSPEIESISAWIRTISRNCSINLIRSVTRSKVDSDANLEILPGKRGLDLYELNEEQRIVAQLLSQGNSQRSIMTDTGLSRRRLKAAMAAIAEYLKPAERKSA